MSLGFLCCLMNVSYSLKIPPKRNSQINNKEGQKHIKRHIIAFSRQQLPLKSPANTEVDSNNTKTSENNNKMTNKRESHKMNILLEFIEMAKSSNTKKAMNEQHRCARLYHSRYLVPLRSFTMSLLLAERYR